MGNNRSKVAYDKHRKTDLSVDDNICVIGAGPAGIHMSSLLKQRGYKNITIFEKSNRIGGKSFTIRDKDDVPHEMGTCYLHPEYKVIRDLLKEYSIGKEVEIANGKNARNMFKTHLDDNIHAIDENGIDFMSWLLDKTEEQILPEILRDWIPDELSIIPLKYAVHKYKKIHRKIFGKYRYTLPPKPKNFDDINMTFLEFLEKHGLQSLLPMLTYSLSVQGYGIIDTIPAFYGLWWITPELLTSVFDICRNLQKKPIVTMLYDGFQNLWETIAEKNNLNIIFECNITKIERGDKIKIFCKNKKSEMVFDHLIIAADNKDMMELYHPTIDEFNTFNQLTHFTFATTLYESDVPTVPEAAVEIWPHILWKANGNLCAHRHSKTAVRPPNKSKKSWSCLSCSSLLQAFSPSDRPLIKRERAVAYQFKDKPPTIFDDVILRKQLLTDLKSYGGEMNVEILHQEVWKYFGHYSAKDVNNGYPWKILNMQGTKNTWYIGSSVCFESVLDVVSYNLMLLEMFKIGGLKFKKI